MDPAKSFRDLMVWQKAHAMTLAVYRYSSGFPRDETFGLRSQIRRSSVSVPANIAEAFPKKTKPEKLRLLNIAQGSLEETRYYLVLANDLQFGNTYEVERLAEEVSRLLNGYMGGIRKYIN